MSQTVPPPGRPRPPVPAGEPEPAWDVATLFPAQGSWSERDYLELPTNRLVEFSDGLIEVLPAPTRRHQAIVAFLYESLKAFVVARNLGKVHFAPLPVHLWRGKYREPDVIFVRRENEKALEGDYLEGADLIMEVVSADDPERDWVKKREEYPRAGIPEYWIADPALGQITVLTLSGSVYAVHGDFATGDQATARLLPGFQVPVADALRGA